MAHSLQDTTSPVNTTLALDFYTSGGVYEVTVAEHTARHALKSRAEWRIELLGDDDADSPQDVPMLGGGAAEEMSQFISSDIEREI